MNFGELFQRLRHEGLVESADVPAGLEAHAASPWFIRVMLGFAGWLAGLFLVGFLGGLFAMNFRQGAAMIAMSAVLCGVAAAIYRLRGGEVIAQVALAISMAGQVFFVLGLLQFFPRLGADVAWLVALFQVALVIIMRNFLHRFLSTVFAAAALYYGLEKVALVGAGAGVLAVAFAILWLKEPQWRASARAETGSAVGLGLGVALTVWAAPVLLRESFVHSQLSFGRFAEGIGYGAGLVIYAWGATRGATLQTRALALAASLLLVVAGHPAPGVIASALVMLAAYGAGQRVLAAWAVAAVFAYLGTYYYRLDQTLLAKSITLAASGVALLAVRWIMLRLFRDDAHE